MEIKLKETREELNIEVGDLLVLKDGSIRVIVTDGDVFASMCLKTFMVKSCWYGSIKDLLEKVYPKEARASILRVISSSKLEIREID